MDVISVNNLYQKYGKSSAINDISLSITEGEILGVLGPNGAGKTTLIKLLIGMLHPTSGNISILGLNPVKEKWKLRKQIGYMPQDASLYENLTVRENIGFFAKGLNGKINSQRVDEVISFTQMGTRSNSQVFTLSGGLKKRTSLACSMVNGPKVLFLDEPTAAIDPYLKVKSWTLFRDLAKSGVTLIISTHIMDEALLCDKLLILDEGKLVAFDTPKNILMKGKAYINVNGGEKMEIDNTPDAIAQKLHEYGLRDDINSLSIEAQNLDDVVLSITKEK